MGAAREVGTHSRIDFFDLGVGAADRLLQRAHALERAGVQGVDALMFGGQPLFGGAHAFASVGIGSRALAVELRDAITQLLLPLVQAGDCLLALLSVAGPA